MENKVDKLPVLAGYHIIMNAGSSRRYQEEVFDSEDGKYLSELAGWQFRISILPTPENVNQAAIALKKYFREHKQTPSFTVKCLILNNEHENQDALDAWDPVYLQGNDRNQRGKEVCVYFGVRDNQSNNAYIKSPDEWKGFMLDLWKVLQDEGIIMGYSATPSGDKAPPSQPGLLLPFSYTAFKPFKQRHKTLNETEYNPFTHTDPLEDMNAFTWDDLAKANINQEIVKREMTMRIEWTKSHLLAVRTAISNKILEINAKGDGITGPVYSAEADNLSSAKPINPEDAANEIAGIKDDFRNDDVQHYLQSLNLVNIDIDVCIDKAPGEMQKVYRSIMHAVHEESALDSDLKHLTVEELEHNSTAETLKDVAMTFGLLVASTGVGAGIGALIGTFVLPVVGTAAGAIIGTCFGGAIGFIGVGLQGMIRNIFSSGEYDIRKKLTDGVFSTLGSTALGVIIGTLIAPGLGSVIGGAIGFGVGAVTSLLVGWATSTRDEDEHLSVEDITFSAEDITSTSNPYTHPQLQSSLTNDSISSIKPNEIVTQSSYLSEDDNDEKQNEEKENQSRSFS